MARGGRGTAEGEKGGRIQKYPVTSRTGGDGRTGEEGGSSDEFLPEEIGRIKGKGMLEAPKKKRTPNLRKTRRCNADCMMGGSVGCQGSSTGG